MSEVTAKRRRGRYVVLEGDEGAGKTTQITWLVDHLRDELDIEAQFVREPGGDPVAEQLREIVKHTSFPLSPMAEVAIFSAARANMLANIVIPKLEAGIWVVADRSYLSTLAYQGMGRGLGSIDFARSVKLFALPLPDLICVLDIPLAASQQRLQSRGETSDRFESESLEYRQRVNEAYRQYGAGGEAELIDGNKTEQEVADEVWAVLLDYYYRWEGLYQSFGTEPYLGLKRTY